MSNRNSFMMFVLGSAVGFWIARRFYPRETETFEREGIDSVAIDDSKADPNVVVKSKGTQSYDRRKLAEYTNYARELGYTKSSANASSMNRPQPYVISPQEFGSIEDYEQISLTYYADSVLVGSNGRALTTDEIANMVGDTAVTRFGEYEDDSVFVRNDELKCDFEILLDEGTYMDMVISHPYLVQEE